MPSRRPTAPRAPGPGRGTSAPSPRRGAGRGTDGGSRRPPTAARPRSAPTGTPTAVPRGLSRRAALIAVLLLVVAAATAPNLRDFVNQQAELAAVTEEVAQREQRVADLQDQLDRWEDPAFVMAQARQRFGFVMPGEIGYVVLDEPVAEVEAADPSTAAAADAARTDRAWFGSLWESLELAGEEVPAGGPAPEPDAADVDPEPLPAPSP